MITHLEPECNLECKVKWALGSITMNKASGGDGIPVELFQILKGDAVKMLHSICQQILKTQQCPWWLRRGKASTCNVRDLGLIPRSGRSPGEGNGNPLQYSSLENSKDGGVCRATVHGVAKSQTRLGDFTSLHTS